MTAFTILLLLGLVSVSLVSSTPLLADPLSKEFIDHINSVQNTWVAAPNPIAVSRTFNGVLKREKRILKTKQFRTLAADLPEEFDARVQWPQCADIIGNIRDQGACGSCWALGAAEAISDRICIASNGALQVNISAQDLTSCCIDCSGGFGGCNGGYPDGAWSYWSTSGIVTGGAYKSNSGCLTYQLEPCEHHVNGSRVPCDGTEMVTPECVPTCETSFKGTWEEDKKFASDVYYVSVGLDDDNEEKIKQEVYENGPVEVDFAVYSDFLAYQSGVYSYVAGVHEANHAVKLLGWGVDNGVKYWLIANSWNDDWGENGYFRILRGVDECGIEEDAIGGVPLF